MNKMFPVFLIMALGFLALILVWERVYATHMGKALSTARDDLKLKQARNEHFRLELETLKSPSSLERMAGERLGMVYPEPDRVVTLHETGREFKSRSGWLARMFEKKDSALQ